MMTTGSFDIRCPSCASKVPYNARARAKEECGLLRTVVQCRNTGSCCNYCTYQNYYVLPVLFRVWEASCQRCRSCPTPGSTLQTLRGLLHSESPLLPATIWACVTSDKSLKLKGGWGVRQTTRPPPPIGLWGSPCYLPQFGSVGLLGHTWGTLQTLKGPSHSESAFISVTV